MMRICDLSEYAREKTSINILPSSIRYWEKMGLLKDVNRKGKGKQREFNEKNIDRVVLISVLRDFNISCYAIKKLLDNNDSEIKKIVLYKIRLLKTQVIPYLEEVLSK